jgi:hypothetical protein
MSIFDEIQLITESHDISEDQRRIAYIKKTLNLKDHEKIKDVSTSKLKVFVEMNGFPARIALTRYAVICEDVAENKRIVNILDMKEEK